MSYLWDIDEQIFKGADVGAIEKTWNRLVQENSTDDIIPLHRSNESRNGMLCAKQVVAFCGFAQNLLLPSLFRQAASQILPFSKWWESVDDKTDIAIEVTYAFDATRFKHTEEATEGRFASHQVRYTHEGVVSVTYTVCNGSNAILGTYIWKSSVRLHHQTHNNVCGHPSQCKKFSGLGPLFHIVNGKLDCDQDFCELLRHVTEEAPLHNECVLKLRNAFQILQTMQQFHLDMSRLFWTSRHAQAATSLFTDIFIPYTPFVPNCEAETDKLAQSMTQLRPTTEASHEASKPSSAGSERHSGLLKGVEKFYATLVAAMRKFGSMTELVDLFQVSILLDHVIKRMDDGFNEIYTSYKLRLVECGGGALFSAKNLRATLNTLKDKKARQEYNVEKGLFQYCDEDYVMTGYVSFPYKNSNGRVHLGTRHLLSTMQQTIPMTEHRSGMHTIDLGIRCLHVKGAHHVHVATLPNFANQMPPRIKVFGKGMYNGKPKIVMIGNTEGAVNTVKSCFCGYLCPNFIQLVGATEQLSDVEFNSKLGLLNAQMTNMISQLREIAMAQHSVCIDIVDFIPVLATQLGFTETEVDNAGWPLHNCALELVKCGASLCNLEARRRNVSDTTSTLQEVLAEMQTLRQKIMESGKLQEERNRRRLNAEERDAHAKRRRTTSCPCCDDKEYEAQSNVWKRNCAVCNPACDDVLEEDCEVVYRGLAAQEPPQACGVSGAPPSTKFHEDTHDAVVVDDFNGSKQLNILKYLGEKLDLENFGIATSYAILNVDTPPMLASDNIGALPEEANTAPTATQYHQYGNTEEVQRFQLTLMMENYYRQNKFLNVQRYTLTVLYTRFKQDLSSSLQMAQQYDITKTFPKTDAIINQALKQFAEKFQ